MRNGFIYVLFAIFIGVLFAYFFSAGITKRLNSLLDISNRTRKGQKDLRANDNYEDEIGQLATGFNQMLDSLEEESRKLHETQTKLLESNANKDKFFSIISHDLKSPFNGILGITEMLQTDYDDYTNDEKKDMVSVLRNLSLKTFDLLDGLLQWAQTQTGRMEYQYEMINIYECSLTVIGYLKGNALLKNITFENLVSPNTAAFADKKATLTILRNLVSNAIKFCEKNGIVKIEAILHDNKIEISVEDNGIGMSETDKAKLFKIEVHHTTVGTYNEVGTGVGLILCKELVEQQSGKIWVESQLGKGSKFIFTLPKNEVK
jgi:signal transduction histidine kinase